MSSHQVSSSSVLSCVCWLYRSDDGHYNPYSPDHSAFVEDSFGAKDAKHRINKTEYEVDFTTMTQRNVTTGTKRPIQRAQVTLPSTPHLMGYWEWEEKPGRYVPYGIQATVDIELAYINGKHNVNLSSTPACKPYTIDLINLHQTRHSYNTQRKIRRVSLPHPLHQYLKDQTIPTGGGLSSSSVSGPYSSQGRQLRSSSKIKGTTSIAPISSGCGPSTSSPSKRLHSSSTVGTTSHMTSVTSFTSPATSLLDASPPNKKPVTKKKGKKASVASASVSINDMKTDTVMCKGKTETKQGDERFKKYLKKVTLNFGQNEPCPICMSDLTEFSGFEEGVGLPVPTPSLQSSSSPPTPEIYKLRRCGHMLHRACLIMYIKNKPDGLVCPTCKKIHGVKTGDMPKGSMTQSIQSCSLPGHSGYNTIEITYNFTSGTQDGKRYKATGFPRVCYLPNSPKGQKVLRLLQIAWKRRLTFTIGTSVTTGATDTIVWNEIHHKTEAHGNSTGHGYPDDNYLDNVLAELAAQGVNDDDDDDDDDSSGSEDSSTTSDEDL